MKKIAGMIAVDSTVPHKTQGIISFLKKAIHSNTHKKGAS